MADRADQLQTLIKCRRAVRDQRQAELVAAEQAEQAVQADAEHAAVLLATAQATARAHLAGDRLDVTRAREDHAYGQSVRERLAAFRTQQHELSDRVRQLRAALLAADGEVRKLEKLQERQHCQQHAAFCKSDTRQLDELAQRKVGVAPAANFSDK